VSVVSNPCSRDVFGCTFVSYFSLSGSYLEWFVQVFIFFREGFWLVFVRRGPSEPQRLIQDKLMGQTDALFVVRIV
jgi:hypothetical protein